MRNRQRGTTHLYRKVSMFQPFIINDVDEIIRETQGDHRNCLEISNRPGTEVDFTKQSPWWCHHSCERRNLNSGFCPNHWTHTKNQNNTFHDRRVSLKNNETATPTLRSSMPLSMRLRPASAASDMPVQMSPQENALRDMRSRYIEGDGSTAEALRSNGS